MNRRWEAPLAALLPAAYLLLLFALPLAVLLLHAMGIDERDAGQVGTHPAQSLLLLLGAFANALAQPFVQERLIFTVAQAAASTLLTLALGIPLAYLFSHHRFPLRRTLRALFTAPFVLPAIVVALALHAYVGPGSLLGVDLLTPLGPVGAILLAHVFYNTSIVLRLLGNYWERVPQALPEAARTLGASPWHTFWHVQLPLVRPALLAATALVFLFDLSSFGIILLLGGRGAGTVETTIYELGQGFRPDAATAAVLGLLQLALAYTVLLVFLRLERRLRTPWLPRLHDTRTPLPAWGWPLLAGAAVLLAGPPIALVLLSFRLGGQWDLTAWTTLFTGNGLPETGYSAADAIGNSLGFAGIMLLPALLLGFLAALSVARARRSSVWDALLSLPLGASSIVIGLGILLTYDGQWMPDLRTHPFRIVLAHILLAFPFVARVLAPNLAAITPRLREAARTLGARPWRVALRLDLPLALPALVVAAVYAIAFSLGEFGAALLLRTPATVTVPIAIHDGFTRYGSLAHAQGTAFAAILLLLAVAAFLALERLGRSVEGGFR